MKRGVLRETYVLSPRKLKKTSACFAEIPVLVDGKVQFIDVETLVLKVHGVQVPCNRILTANGEGCGGLGGDKS